MSVAYFLVSESEAINVAQVGLSGFTFYSGEVDCMLKLRNFLERNMGESLKFLSEHVVNDMLPCEDEPAQITEIEWTPNHLRGRNDAI